jgi:hypothetical protein
MFSTTAIRLAARVADVIDEMLVGDFDYVEDESGLYADVDYDRTQPRPGRVELRSPRVRRQCNAPAPSALTAAAYARR